MNEKKEPLGSETLGVVGQDADQCAGLESRLHPEGRGGASNASTRGHGDGQKTRVTRMWKGGDQVHTLLPSRGPISR